MNFSHKDALLTAIVSQLRGFDRDDNPDGFPWFRRLKVRL